MLENPCTFLLAKEKTWKCIFNTNSKLFQNRTVKQILAFKTTVNCLFNDIWCYLVIVSIDWKIGIFQQTVLRVCCIFNWRKFIVWLLLLLEVLGNMCIAIVYFPGCDSKNFELNLIFLIMSFFYMTKSQDKNLNILRAKRAFKVK